MKQVAGMSAATPAPAPVLPPVDSPAPQPEDRPRKLQARTFDDLASLVGSVAGGLGLVWVLFEQVLPLSGVVGFVVCWYAASLGLYALVTALRHPSTVVIDRLMSGLVHAGAGLVGLVLASTVGFIFIKGWPALHHLNFYTQDMAGVRPTAPLNQGGILHAVVGSAIEVGLAVMIALPLGVSTAVYMTEVGGRLSNAVRTVIEAMTALPDIVAGLFIYAVVVLGLGWQKDGLAVSLALAVTMLPVTARSAEVVLKVVSSSLREAGLALGATTWRTVRHVVLPTARPGLATALILGIARITGETAPLLIVSGASTFFNHNPFNNQMNSLPLFIYSAVRSPEQLYIARGYGAAALLLLLILGLFCLTRYLARAKGGGR